MQILFYGLLGTSMAGGQEKIQEAMEAERSKQLEKLEDSADNAATEEEAEEFRARHDELANQPIPQMPDVSNMIGMKSPGVLGAYIFDCLTGLILNVMMVVSGIGLLKYRAWARKMAVWVAGLKLLRLVIICGLTIGIIAPGVSEGLGEFVGEAAKMNPRGEQPQDLQVDQVKAVYSWSLIIWGVVLLVLGAIYPLVSMRVLTRPNVIRACTATNAAPASQF